MIDEETGETLETLGGLPIAPGAANDFPEDELAKAFEEERAKFLDFMVTMPLHEAVTFMRDVFGALGFVVAKLTLDVLPVEDELDELDGGEE